MLPWPTKMHDKAAHRGPERINNLQVARALGAIAVIVFHTIPSTRDYGFQSPWLFWFAGWGYQGVDVFFVISGFVMVLTEARRNRNWIAFLVDRLGRIGPVYWLTTTLLFVLLLVFPGLFRTMSPSLPIYLESMTFTTFLFDPGVPPLIFVGWTLEYEMLLYVVFAATLFAAGWPRRLLQCTALLLLLVLAGIASPMLFEFMFGQVCALLYLAGWRLPARGALLSLGLGLLLLCLPLFMPARDDMTMQHHALRFLVYGFPATLVVIAIVQMRQSANRLLILIGDASYSIYLVQVFTIALFCKLSAKVAPGAPAALVVLAATAGTVVAGLLLYVLIEKPAAQIIKRLRRSGEIQRAATANMSAIQEP